MLARNAQRTKCLYSQLRNLKFNNFEPEIIHTSNKPLGYKYKHTIL